jgi:hypothetical protein
MNAGGWWLSKRREAPAALLGFPARTATDPRLQLALGKQLLLTRWPVWHDKRNNRRGAAFPGTFAPPPASYFQKLWQGPVSDDHRLIADCLQGDTAAFGELVRRYQDRLFNTVYRLVDNAEPIIKTAVKAATFHDLRVAEEAGQFVATVVLDV